MDMLVYIFVLACLTCIVHGTYIPLRLSPSPTPSFTPTPFRQISQLYKGPFQGNLPPIPLIMPRPEIPMYSFPLLSLQSPWTSPPPMFTPMVPITQPAHRSLGSRNRALPVVPVRTTAKGGFDYPRGSFAAASATRSPRPANYDRVKVQLAPRLLSTPKFSFNPEIQVRSRHVKGSLDMPVGFMVNSFVVGANSPRVTLIDGIPSNMQVEGTVSSHENSQSTRYPDVTNYDSSYQNIRGNRHTNIGSDRRTTASARESGLQMDNLAGTGNQKQQMAYHGSDQGRLVQSNVQSHGTTSSTRPFQTSLNPQYNSDNYGRSGNKVYLQGSTQHDIHQPKNMQGVVHSMASRVGQTHNEQNLISSEPNIFESMQNVFFDFTPNQVSGGSVYDQNTYQSGNDHQHVSGIVDSVSAMRQPAAAANTKAQTTSSYQVNVLKDVNMNGRMEVFDAQPVRNVVGKNIIKTSSQDMQGINTLSKTQDVPATSSDTKNAAQHRTASGNQVDVPVDRYQNNGPGVKQSNVALTNEQYPTRALPKSGGQHSTSNQADSTSRQIVTGDLSTSGVQQSASNQAASTGGQVATGDLSTSGGQQYVSNQAASTGGQYTSGDLSTSGGQQYVSNQAASTGGQVTTGDLSTSGGQQYVSNQATSTGRLVATGDLSTSGGQQSASNQAASTGGQYTTGDLSSSGGQQYVSNEAATTSGQIGAGDLSTSGGQQYVSNQAASTGGQYTTGDLSTSGGQQYISNQAVKTGGQVTTGDVSTSGGQQYVSNQAASTGGQVTTGDLSTSGGQQYVSNQAASTGRQYTTGDLSTSGGQQYISNQAVKTGGQVTTGDVSTSGGQQYVSNQAASTGGQVTTGDLSTSGGQQYVSNQAASTGGQVTTGDLSTSGGQQSMSNQATSANRQYGTLDFPASASHQPASNQGLTTTGGQIGAGDLSTSGEQQSTLNQAASINGQLTTGDLSTSGGQQYVFNQAATTSGQIGAGDMSTSGGQQYVSNQAATTSGQYTSGDLSTSGGQQYVSNQAATTGGQYTTGDLSTSGGQQSTSNQAASTGGQVTTGDLSTSGGQQYVSNEAATTRGQIGAGDLPTSGGQQSIANQAVSVNGQYEPLDFPASTGHQHASNQGLTSTGGQIGTVDVSTYGGQQFASGQAATLGTQDFLDLTQTTTNNGISAHGPVQENSANGINTINGGIAAQSLGHTSETSSMSIGIPQFINDQYLGVNPVTAGIADQLATAEGQYSTNVDLQGLMPIVADIFGINGANVRTQDAFHNNVQSGSTGDVRVNLNGPLGMQENQEKLSPVGQSIIQDMTSNVNQYGNLDLSGRQGQSVTSGQYVESTSNHAKKSQQQDQNIATVASSESMYTLPPVFPVQASGLTSQNNLERDSVMGQGSAETSNIPQGGSEVTSLEKEFMNLLLQSRSQDSQSANNHIDPLAGQGNVNDIQVPQRKHVLKNTNTFDTTQQSSKMTSIENTRSVFSINKTNGNTVSTPSNRQTPHLPVLNEVDTHPSSPSSPRAHGASFQTAFEINPLTKTASDTNHNPSSISSAQKADTTVGNQIDMRIAPAPGTKKDTFPKGRANKITKDQIESATERARVAVRSDKSLSEQQTPPIQSRTLPSLKGFSVFQPIENGAGQQQKLNPMYDSSLPSVISETTVPGFATRHQESISFPQGKSSKLTHALTPLPPPTSQPTRHNIDSNTAQATLKSKTFINTFASPISSPIHSKLPNPQNGTATHTYTTSPLSLLNIQSYSKQTALNNKTKASAETLHSQSVLQANTSNIPIPLHRDPTPLGVPTLTKSSAFYSSKDALAMASVLQSKQPFEQKQSVSASTTVVSEGGDTSSNILSQRIHHIPAQLEHAVRKSSKISFHGKSKESGKIPTTSKCATVICIDKHISSKKIKEYLTKNPSPKAIGSLQLETSLGSSTNANKVDANSVSSTQEASQTHLQLLPVLIPFAQSDATGQTSSSQRVVHGYGASQSHTSSHSQGTFIKELSSGITPESVDRAVRGQGVTPKNHRISASVGNIESGIQTHSDPIQKTNTSPLPSNRTDRTSNQTLKCVTQACIDRKISATKLEAYMTSNHSPKAIGNRRIQASPSFRTITRASITNEVDTSNAKAITSSFKSVTHNTNKMHLADMFPSNTDFVETNPPLNTDLQSPKHPNTGSNNDLPHIPRVPMNTSTDITYSRNSANISTQTKSISTQSMTSLFNTPVAHTSLTTQTARIHSNTISSNNPAYHTYLKTRTEGVSAHSKPSSPIDPIHPTNTAANSGSDNIYSNTRSSIPPPYSVISANPKASSSDFPSLRTYTPTLTSTASTHSQTVSSNIQTQPHYSSSNVERASTRSNTGSPIQLTHSTYPPPNPTVDSIYSNTIASPSKVGTHPPTNIVNHDILSKSEFYILPTRPTSEPANSASDISHLNTWSSRHATGTTSANSKTSSLDVSSQLTYTTMNSTTASMHTIHSPELPIKTQTDGTHSITDSSSLSSHPTYATINIETASLQRTTTHPTTDNNIVRDNLKANFTNNESLNRSHGVPAAPNSSSHITSHSQKQSGQIQDTESPNRSHGVPAGPNSSSHITFHSQKQSGQIQDTESPNRSHGVPAAPNSSSHITFHSQKQSGQIQDTESPNRSHGVPAAPNSSSHITFHSQKQSGQIQDTDNIQFPVDATSNNTSNHILLEHHSKRTNSSLTLKASNCVTETCIDKTSNQRRLYAYLTSKASPKVIGNMQLGTATDLTTPNKTVSTTNEISMSNVREFSSSMSRVENDTKSLHTISSLSDTSYIHTTPRSANTGKTSTHSNVSSANSEHNISYQANTDVDRKHLNKHIPNFPTYPSTNTGPDIKHSDTVSIKTETLTNPSINTGTDSTLTNMDSSTSSVQSSQSSTNIQVIENSTHSNDHTSSASASTLYQSKSTGSSNIKTYPSETSRNIVRASTHSNTISSNSPTHPTHPPTNARTATTRSSTLLFDIPIHALGTNSPTSPSKLKETRVANSNMVSSTIPIHLTYPSEYTLGRHSYTDSYIQSHSTNSPTNTENAIQQTKAATTQSLIKAETASTYSNTDSSNILTHPTFPPIDSNIVHLDTASTDMLTRSTDTLKTTETAIRHSNMGSTSISTNPTGPSTNAGTIVSAVTSSNIPSQPIYSSTNPGYIDVNTSTHIPTHSTYQSTHTTTSSTRSSNFRTNSTPEARHTGTAGMPSNSGSSTILDHSTHALRNSGNTRTHSHISSANILADSHAPTNTGPTVTHQNSGPETLKSQNTVSASSHSTTKSSRFLAHHTHSATNTKHVSNTPAYPTPNTESAGTSSSEIVPAHASNVTSFTETFPSPNAPTAQHSAAGSTITQTKRTQNKTITSVSEPLISLQKTSNDPNRIKPSIPPLPRSTMSLDGGGGGAAKVVTLEKHLTRSGQHPDTQCTPETCIDKHVSDTKLQAYLDSNDSPKPIGKLQSADTVTSYGETRSHVNTGFTQIVAPEGNTVQQMSGMGQPNTVLEGKHATDTMQNIHDHSKAQNAKQSHHTENTKTSNTTRGIVNQLEAERHSSVKTMSANCTTKICRDKMISAKKRKTISAQNISPSTTLHLEGQPLHTNSKSETVSNSPLTSNGGAITPPESISHLYSQLVSNNGRLTQGKINKSTKTFINVPPLSSRCHTSNCTNKQKISATLATSTRHHSAHLFQEQPSQKGNAFTPTESYQNTARPLEGQSIPLTGKSINDPIALHNVGASLNIPQHLPNKAAFRHDLRSHTSHANTVSKSLSRSGDTIIQDNKIHQFVQRYGEPSVKIETTTTGSHRGEASVLHGEKQARTQTKNQSGFQQETKAPGSGTSSGSKCNQTETCINAHISYSLLSAYLASKVAPAPIGQMSPETIASRIESDLSDALPAPHISILSTRDSGYNSIHPVQQQPETGIEVKATLSNNRTRTSGMSTGPLKTYNKEFANQRTIPTNGASSKYGVSHEAEVDTEPPRLHRETVSTEMGVHSENGISSSKHQDFTFQNTLHERQPLSEIIMGIGGSQKQNLRLPGGGEKSKDSGAHTGTERPLSASTDASSPAPLPSYTSIIPPNPSRGGNTPTLPGLFDYTAVTGQGGGYTGTTDYGPIDNEVMQFLSTQGFNNLDSYLQNELRTLDSPVPYTPPPSSASSQGSTSGTGATAVDVKTTTTQSLSNQLPVDTLPLSGSQPYGRSVSTVTIDVTNPPAAESKPTQQNVQAYETYGSVGVGTVNDNIIPIVATNHLHNSNNGVLDVTMGEQGQNKQQHSLKNQERTLRTGHSTKAVISESITDPLVNSVHSTASHLSPVQAGFISMGGTDHATSQLSLQGHSHHRQTMTLAGIQRVQPGATDQQAGTPTDQGEATITSGLQMNINSGGFPSDISQDSSATTTGTASTSFTSQHDVGGAQWGEPSSGMTNLLPSTANTGDAYTSQQLMDMNVGDTLLGSSLTSAAGDPRNVESTSLLTSVANEIPSFTAVNYLHSAFSEAQSSNGAGEVTAASSEGSNTGASDFNRGSDSGSLNGQPDSRAVHQKITEAPEFYQPAPRYVDSDQGDSGDAQELSQNMVNTDNKFDFGVSKERQMSLHDGQQFHSNSERSSR